MKDLSRLLADYLDRPVLDQTRLAGKYDVHLDLSAAELRDPQLAPSALQLAIGKLGLRLQATKRPQDVLVIDHVERPTEN